MILRGLCFLYSDYTSSYEILLLKAGKVTMNISRMKILRVEIHKTINDINPKFLTDLFTLKENKRLVRKSYKLNLEVPKWNQVIFVEKLLGDFGSKIWNNLATSHFTIFVTLCNTFLYNNFLSHLAIPVTLCNKFMSHFVIPATLCNNFLSHLLKDPVTKTRDL